MAQIFHDRLKSLIHEYIVLTYTSTKQYSNDEKFGLISQDRRAAVSVMLNYIEGFARMKDNVMFNFFETSFASLKETIYCRYLAKSLGYITEDEIAAMLYTTINALKTKNM